MRAEPVFVGEEGTPGRTRGAEVAQPLADASWAQVTHPVDLLISRTSAIPAAR